MSKERIWQIYDEVGSAACASGHLKLARQMFTAAVETCGSDNRLSIERAHSLIGLADTHYLGSDSDEAERLYKRVINLAIRFNVDSGRGRLILARSLDRLGSLLMQQGKFAAALKLLQRSARILEKTALDDSALRQVLLRISYINTICGDTDRALETLQQARAM
ncbi:MAG TPA: tetratricopeptide repeat protein [Planktothrix sp.]|jgi:tetratricopeptide (TPR) repeat protein